MADEERGGVRRWATRIGSVLAMLPVLYVLSVGPVVGWAERHPVSDEQIESLDTFYTPLQLIYDESQPVASAFDWYIDL